MSAARNKWALTSGVLSTAKMMVKMEGGVTGIVTNEICCCTQYRCSQRERLPSEGCEHRLCLWLWWRCWCSPLSRASQECWKICDVNDPESYAPLAYDYAASRCSSGRATTQVTCWEHENYTRGSSYVNQSCGNILHSHHRLNMFLFLTIDIACVRITNQILIDTCSTSTSNYDVEKLAAGIAVSSVLLWPSQSHAVVLKNSMTMSNRPLQTVPQRLSIKMVKSMPTKQPRVHSDADKISSTQNVSVSLLCAVVDGLIFYNSPLKPTRNATLSLCCPKSCASHQCHHSLQLLYIPRCSSTLFPVNYSEFERFKGASPFIRLVDTVMRIIQCDRYSDGFFHHWIQACKLLSLKLR